MAEDGDSPPKPKWEGPVDDAGLPHGTGKMTYPPPPLPEDEEEQEDPKPGDTYEGQMEHGKRSGQGKYTWGAQGAVYEGEYVDNRRQGLGTMAFPDKSRYEGSFAADKLEGDGVMYYGNRDIYHGGFKAGKKHGSGQMYFQAQRCMFIGVWADGAFVNGKWVQQDGTTFTGSFEGSVPKEGSFNFSRSGLVSAGAFSSKTGQWMASAAQ